MRGFLRFTSLWTEFSSEEEDAQFLELFLCDEFIVFSPAYLSRFVFMFNYLYIDFFTVGAVSLELSLIVSPLD